MARLPEHLPVDPATLTCPRCGAKPGRVCDTLNGEVELVHIERIKAAARKNAAARKAPWEMTAGKGERSIGGNQLGVSLHLPVGCCRTLLSSVISLNILAWSFSPRICEQSSLTLGSSSPLIEVVSAELKSTNSRKKSCRHSPRIPLLSFIPHVQEVGVAGRGHVPPAFVDGAIQGGSHVFLAFR